MKDCFTKHTVLHSIAGVGVGLLLAGLIPLAGNTAVTLGVVLVIVGAGAEILAGDKKKKK